MNSGMAQSNSRAKRARAKTESRFGDGLRQPHPAGRDSARPLGQLLENARDFRRFFFAELHEAIVELDRFERLDENRLARGARGMNDALHLRGGRRRARE